MVMKRFGLGCPSAADAEVRLGLNTDNQDRGDFSLSLNIWRIVLFSLRKFLTNSENPA